MILEYVVEILPVKKDTGEYVHETGLFPLEMINLILEYLAEPLLVKESETTCVIPGTFFRPHRQPDFTEVSRPYPIVRAFILGA